MTIAEFLLARIAEDEAAAHDDDVPSKTVIGGRTVDREARVLAECEAKRRIVEMAMSLESPQSLGDRMSFPAARSAFEVVLLTLGNIYADHVNYRDEWRP